MTFTTGDLYALEHLLRKLRCACGSNPFIRATDEGLEITKQGVKPLLFTKEEVSSFDSEGNIDLEENLASYLQDVLR